MEVDVPEPTAHISLLTYYVIFYLPVVLLGWAVSSLFSLALSFWLWRQVGKRVARERGVSISDIISGEIDPEVYERYLEARRSIFRWKEDRG